MGNYKRPREGGELDEPTVMVELEIEVDREGGVRIASPGYGRPTITYTEDEDILIIETEQGEQKMILTLKNARNFLGTSGRKKISFAAEPAPQQPEGDKTVSAPPLRIPSDTSPPTPGRSASGITASFEPPSEGDRTTVTRPLNFTTPPVPAVPPESLEYGQHTGYFEVEYKPPRRIPRTVIIAISSAIALTAAAVLGNIWYLRKDESDAGAPVIIRINADTGAPDESLQEEPVIIEIPPE